MKKSKIIFCLFSLLAMMNCDSEYFEYDSEYFEFDLPRVELPVLINHDISEINSNSALCSAEITFDGGYTITSRGFCYATTLNPTTSDNVINSGYGSGFFSDWILNLQPNTLYYVKAFATNEIGTAYGSQYSFWTHP